MITTEQLDQFARDVVVATKQYIDSGEETNPTVIENIKQYLDATHVYETGLFYRDAIQAAREDGNQTIIDIGSGINVAKLIDPDIVTTNPIGLNVNGYKFFRYINKEMGLPVDIELGDLRRDIPWLDTGSLKFDCAFVFRFLPFFGSDYFVSDYKRFINGVRNCLAPNGTVWYNTENEPAFFKIARSLNQDHVWKRLQLVADRQFLESTKEQLDTLNVNRVPVA